MRTIWPLLTLALVLSACTRDEAPDPSPEAAPAAEEQAAQQAPAAELPPVAETVEPLAAGTVPERWHDEMQKQLPHGTRLVQTLAWDLDGDGVQEWIGIGEPDGTVPGGSVAIFTAARGKKGPEMRFSQRVLGDLAEANQQPTVVGGVVMPMPPAGDALLVVGARPMINGNSHFYVQAWAWNGERFRAIIPEQIAFRTQGGFAVADLDPKTEGVEVATWTFLHAPNEQLFDAHRYETKIYRWDGIRFTSPDWPTRTEERLASPAEAARTLGIQDGDLRRSIPRVAEVP